MNIFKKFIATLTSAWRSTGERNQPGFYYHGGEKPGGEKSFKEMIAEREKKRIEKFKEREAIERQLSIERRNATLHNPETHEMMRQAQARRKYGVPPEELEKNDGKAV